MLHESRANGKVDNEARWSMSHNDEQLVQLSILTKILLASYTTLQAMGLPVHIDQEVEMTNKSEEC